MDDVYAANRRLHKYVGWLEAKVAELQADADKWTQVYAVWLDIMADEDADAGALIDIMMRLDK